MAEAVKFFGRPTGVTAGELALEPQAAMLVQNAFLARFTKIEAALV